MRAAGSRNLSNLGRVFAVAALVFGLDAISKILGSGLLADRSISLGPVTLRLVRNSGIALGFGSGAPAWLVIGLTLGVTVVVILMTLRGVFGGTAAGLVIGGAVGNITDRALDGTVIDLIDVGRWPTFNLADVFIILGFFWLVSSDSSHAEAVATQRDWS